MKETYTKYMKETYTKDLGKRLVTETDNSDLYNTPIKETYTKLFYGFLYQSFCCVQISLISLIW